MKRWSSYLLISMIMLSIFIAGCSGQEKQVVLDKDSILIEDSYGREVVVPRDINRIACLYAPVGHILEMFGEGEKIVAVSNGFTRDIFLQTLCPKIKQANVVKGGGHFNIEEMMATNPDIIILGMDSFDKATVKKLEKLGVPFMVINFTSIAQQKTVVMKFAKMFGKVEQGQAYCDYYDETISFVKTRTDDIEEGNKKTLYHAINEVARTDMKGTICEEWTDMSGGINVAFDDDEGFDYKINEDKLYVGFEQICLWNPDVIIANGEGIDEYILKNKKFKDITAVKNKEVHLLPVGISRWGHPNSIETPLAIVWTAQKLYPNLFKDTDIKNLARDFYKTFYSYEVDDALMEKILSGRGMRRIKNQ